MEPDAGFAGGGGGVGDGTAVRRDGGDVGAGEAAAFGQADLEADGACLVGGGVRAEGVAEGGAD